jgi:hypothetical protein
MSILPVTQQLSVLRTAQFSKHSGWRSLILVAILAFSLTACALIMASTPQSDVLTSPFMYKWMVSFLPYLIGCIFVLATKSAHGYWRWIELGIILAGAFALRIILVPLPPTSALSRDSWRYLWDARVTLLGHSPYTLAPLNALYIHLRDFIFTNMRFRNVPTIYLPVAQGVFVLSYIISPSNLLALKAIFLLCDMVTCGALLWLLAHRGLDPRRIIMYAWCPLPIIEYALQGHVDPLTIMLTLLAVLCAYTSWRGSRVLTGVLIGLATLTKIYPIILLVAVPRRRDWVVYASCLFTIFLGYLPFLILGHGQVLGFLPTYIREQGRNAGVVQFAVAWFASKLGLTLDATILLECVADLTLVCLAALVVWNLRQRNHMSMEAATLLLIGTVFAISSHVFTWYVPALLPWIALLVGPLWVDRRPSGKGLAIVTAWYFTVVVILYYHLDYPSGLQIYYDTAYWVVAVGLAMAAVISLMRRRETPIARVV